MQSTIEPPLSPQQKVAQLRAQQQQPTPQPLTPDKAAAGDAGSPVATPLKEPRKAERPPVKLAWGDTPPEDQPAPEPEAEAAQKSGAGGGQARGQGGGAKDDAEAAERRRLRNQRKKVAQKRKKVRTQSPDFPTADPALLHGATSADRLWRAQAERRAAELAAAGPGALEAGGAEEGRRRADAKADGAA